jgi:hypothetical protein
MPQSVVHTSCQSRWPCKIGNVTGTLTPPVGRVSTLFTRQLLVSQPLLTLHSTRTQTATKFTVSNLSFPYPVSLCLTTASSDISAQQRRGRRCPNSGTLLAPRHAADEVSSVGISHDAPASCPPEKRTVAGCRMRMRCIPALRGRVTADKYNNCPREPPGLLKRATQCETAV